MTNAYPTRDRSRSISLGVLGIRHVRVPMSLLMLLGISLALGGCATTEAHVTAASIAMGVVDTWTEAMQRLVVLLEGAPQPDEIRAEVGSLKEEYVQRFVAFGRQRSELTAAEQQEMSSLIFAGITALAEEPWYENYMSTNKQHYSSGDVEFSNLLASFNILTQYADFDLLKQQAPEEVARLGIE